jgi:hypothetical protein
MGITLLEIHFKIEDALQHQTIDARMKLIRKVINALNEALLQVGEDNKGCDTAHWGGALVYLAGTIATQLEQGENQEQKKPKASKLIQVPREKALECSLSVEQEANNSVVG